MQIRKTHPRTRDREAPIASAWVTSTTIALAWAKPTMIALVWAKPTMIALVWMTLTVLCGDSVSASNPEGSGASGGDPADVRLNEVGIDFGGSGEVLVELTSSADAAVDISGWVIEVFGVPTIVPDGTILTSGDYLVFNAQTAADFPIGEEVVLFDEVLAPPGPGLIAATGATVIDAVSFGTQGGAPVPPPFPGVSLARSPDGAFGPPPLGNDAQFWTIDFSETFGFQNDAPQPQLGSQLLINEIQIGSLTQPDWIELYNPTGADVDVCGWFVTTGFGLDPICGLVPANGVQAFPLESVLFGDALRLDLFGPFEVRVAQKGIAGVIAFNDCHGDCPDGSAPSDGYDYWTSGGDMQWFALPCTIGNLNDFMGKPCATAGIDPDFDPGGSGSDEEPEVVPSSWGNLKRTFR